MSDGLYIVSAYERFVVIISRLEIHVKSPLWINIGVLWNFHVAGVELEQGWPNVINQSSSRLPVA